MYLNYVSVKIEISFDCSNSISIFGQTNFMKKIFSIAAIALMGLALFSGCSKSSSSSPSYTMNASIGGSSFSSSNCLAASYSGMFTEIYGFAGNSVTPTYPYIGLFLLNYAKTTGTFSLDSTMTANFAQIVTSATTNKVAKSGSITITSTSPNIVGTFSFTTTDGTAVTGGTFTAKSY